MTRGEVAIWLNVAARADLETLEVDSGNEKLRVLRKSGEVAEDATGAVAVEPKTISAPTMGVLLEAHPLAADSAEGDHDIVGYLKIGPCLWVIRTGEHGDWRPAVPPGTLLGFGDAAFKLANASQASTGTV